MRKNTRVASVIPYILCRHSARLWRGPTRPAAAGFRPSMLGMLRLVPPRLSLTYKRWVAWQKKTLNVYFGSWDSALSDLVLHWKKFAICLQISLLVSVNQRKIIMRTVRTGTKNNGNQCEPALKFLRHDVNRTHALVSVTFKKKICELVLTGRKYYGNWCEPCFTLTGSPLQMMF